jgi:hypothetical protein
MTIDEISEPREHRQPWQRADSRSPELVRVTRVPPSREPTVICRLLTRRRPGASPYPFSKAAHNRKRGPTDNIEFTPFFGAGQPLFRPSLWERTTAGGRAEIVPVIAQKGGRLWMRRQSPRDSPSDETIESMRIGESFRRDTNLLSASTLPVTVLPVQTAATRRRERAGISGES